ncbi:MAG: radical SAM protein [Polyangiales bacterium]
MEPLAAHTPSPEARPPGASSRREAVFRDPPPRDDEARALRVEIARALVRAPSLPVALPRFQLTLCDVQVDRRAVELLVGHEAPVAALRVEPADRGDALVTLRAPGAPSAVVRVTVREVHPVAARYARQLAVMAERVQAAVTAEAWAQASALAKTLREIPAGVPLGFFRQLVAGLDHPEGLIRTGFLCNQDCGICWQDRGWGRHPPSQVLRWIEDLRAAHATSVIFSGGEPTLDPSLEDYVRHARALGFTQVTLETNAIQCAKPGRAERLRDAGVTTAFVSLHSPDAETSDAITRAPGTHARTVKGAHALLSAGVPVKFNAVMTQEGLAHLAALPDFLHREFAPYGPLLRGLMLSYPTEPYDPSLAPSIVPEPATLRRSLRAALDRAFALGLTPEGLDGPCGPPLCAFGADPRVASLRPVPEPVDFRRHLPRCEGCAVRGACFGVRIADVAVYGDACAEPLAEVPAGLQNERGSVAAATDPRADS